MESLPGGQALPDVPMWSSQGTGIIKKGVTAVHGMDEALSFLKQFPDDDIYIIGGEEIYRQFLPYCRTAHVTRIDYAYEADTHFPDLDQDPDWQVTAESDEQTYFSLCYEFCRYDRKMEEKNIRKKRITVDINWRT